MWTVHSTNRNCGRTEIKFSRKYIHICDTATQSVEFELEMWEGKKKKCRWLCPANEQLIDKRQRQCVCSTKDKGPWARKIRLREWKAQRFSNARCCRRNCLLISVYCFSLRQRCGLIVIIVEFLWVSSEAVKESCVNMRLKPRKWRRSPRNWHVMSRIIIILNRVFHKFYL